jgi:hypothetical protein
MGSIAHWLMPRPVVGLLLAAVLVMGGVACSDDPETDGADGGPTATATASIPDAERTGTPAPSGGGGSGDSPSVVQTPVPLMYTVQAGDSLSAICQALAPALPSEDCIAQTVQMNNLADPGQIAVGQELLLPVAGPDPEPELPIPSGVQALVTRVIDGDTIEVDRALDGQATVRLIGVNTPETVAPGRT